MTDFSPSAVALLVVLPRDRLHFVHAPAERVHTTKRTAVVQRLQVEYHGEDERWGRKQKAARLLSALPRKRERCVVALQSRCYAALAELPLQKRRYQALELEALRWNSGLGIQKLCCSQGQFKAYNFHKAPLSTRETCCF